MPPRPVELTNRQKAAILLVAIGPEASAKLYRHLPQEDIEQLTLEVARIGRISPETREGIVDEYKEMCLAQAYITEGGLSYAKETLHSAFGAEKAQEILGRVTQAMEILPFDFIKKAEPAQLLLFLQDEHPQTIALILAYLPPANAATVLSGLWPDLRADVARRLAMMDRTPPEVIREIERVLQRKLSSVISTEMTSAGGVKSLVEVLNWVDRSTERTILESLSEEAPEVAEEVKKLMFVFEDIIHLDDRAIMQVLREVDSKELALALKGVSQGVADRIFKCMSERASAMLKEDMEFMGPVRLRAVEEAQQRVVNIIRRLEESGEIVVARGEQEEIIV